MSSNLDKSILEAEHSSARSLSKHAPATTENRVDDAIDTKVPRITMTSVVMTLFVSLGGLLFGFDTGQISGFLEMDDFLHRFGEFDAVQGEFFFINVRSGLIVGLLSVGTLIGSLVAAPVADSIGRKSTISLCCFVIYRPGCSNFVRCWPLVSNCHRSLGNRPRCWRLLTRRA